MYLYNILIAILRNDTDFTNVTLVCEDGEQIEAHKVVLVASSPNKSKTYFEDESYMSTITRKFQHDSDSLISQDSLAAQSKQTTTSIELDQPDVQVKSMMEDSGNMILVGKAPRKAMICKVCGKEGEFGNIKRHIESNHISGGTHPCDVCGKISRFRHGLSQHKLFNHYH